MFHRRLKDRSRREEEANGHASGHLVTVASPDNVASEAYRTLRTNLLYALEDGPSKVIVVTSPGPMEGKSITCANLGVVLAQTDKNALILDCDLRKPTLHKIFGLRNLRGVVDLLRGEHTLQEVWQQSPLLGMKIVTAGPIPPDPAELLYSRRFAQLLDQARQGFDYVLLDSPPTQLVSDPLILAAQGDGVLLVIDLQNTRKGSVRHSMRSLEATGANLLGTVMNNVELSRGGYFDSRHAKIY
jgi:capsular exopolysaccharide synthesis family protein